jgi:methylase of polypeptide subunit release factors
MALGGRLYLAPLGKDIHRILDIGTGTGIWAMEMGMSALLLPLRKLR